MTHLHSLPPLIIGDLSVPLPIIQGGMGIGISLSRLASAMASEGGVGVIATAGVGLSEPDMAAHFTEANARALRKEIQKARSMTQGLLAVNILVALTNYESLARTAMEEGIDMIISGAGLPLNLPGYRPAGCRTKLLPIVSSGRAATILTKRWMERFDYLPDAFVVEGPMAGGHLGLRPEHITDPAHALEHLIPDVLEAVRAMEARYQRRIPVIAAGGIYTGEDILRFLRMGAAGVQMATRFVTTFECDASDAFKQTYIDAKESDLEIIQSPVGMPGRAIRNTFTDDIRKGGKKPYRCAFRCIITCDVVNSPYCIAYALHHARNGEFDKGFAFAGANAWRATEILPLKQVVESLRAEYSQAVEGELHKA
jgi:nitronate monooxygenase